MHDLDVGGRSAWSNDPLSYAGGSVATGRASHAGQVKDEGLDKEATQKRMPNGSDGGRGVRVPTADEAEEAIHWWIRLVAVVKATDLGGGNPEIK